MIPKHVFKKFVVDYISKYKENNPENSFNIKDIEDAIENGFGFAIDEFRKISHEYTDWLAKNDLCGDSKMIEGTEVFGMSKYLFDEDMFVNFMPSQLVFGKFLMERRHG